MLKSNPSRLSKHSRNTCEAIHFQRNCRLVEASKLLKSGTPSEIFFKYFHHQSKDAFSKKKKNSDHFYDRLYWGHMLSLYKIQKQPFRQVP